MAAKASDQNRARPLRDAWHANAADWIRWARTPGHDHFYWRFSRPSLLALLPPPGRLTVDVGCGEGRLTRELHSLGHRILGIDVSPTLLAAARAAEPALPFALADAASLPLADRAADLVVCHLALQDIDDMPGAVAEASRVLCPGGHYCLTIVHPLNGASLTAEERSYFKPRVCSDTLERDGLRMTFVCEDRPLSHYFAALESASLLVEALREPVPDREHVADCPSMERWTRRPFFLQLRAVKPRA